MKWTKEILGGLIGGLAGGMAMKLGSMAAQRAGVIETPLPLKIERELEQRAGIADETSEQQEKMLAMAEHMLISGGLGALYGLASGQVAAPRLLSGLLFGMLVYGINLAGIGPALDLTSGPWNEKPRVVGRRMMMHVLYGVVTAIMRDQVRQRL